MFEDRIFSLASEGAFQKTALELFSWQYDQVKPYQNFCTLLDRRPSNVHRIEDIPFLPIHLFKSMPVLAQGKKAEISFQSSGTTGSIPSIHHVASIELYQRSFLGGFAQFYGDPSEWTILALLPSYLERGNSSLVYMVDALIRTSKHAESGFFLDDYKSLVTTLLHLEKESRKTLLIGVSYALLDLIERQQFKLANTVVMETGGMKGRRKEMVKEELHEVLKQGFGVSEIHSEYGMTELLSQAYSKGHGIYKCPPWMKIMTRDPEDPFSYVQNKTGGINVIDLANIYSCAFIATQDLGKIDDQGQFEILGRFDMSDIRGCNLMVL